MDFTQISTKEIVEHIRGLRKQTEREESGTFYAEGNRIVAQAAKHGWGFEVCVISPQLITNDLVRETVQRLKVQGVPVREVSKKEFNALSFKGNTSGLGGIVRGQSLDLKTIVVNADEHWVILDKVGNPGNVGAVLRTGDAAGFMGVILLDSELDVFHPATVRASMGAVFSQKVIQSTLGELIEWKAKHGVRMIGTDGTGETSFWEADYAPPLAILMGSEREGLSTEKKKICDELVEIPMRGETSDSLNLSVAASLVMYESARTIK